MSRRHAQVVATVVVICGVTAVAQDLKLRDRRIEALVVDAEALPPEFAADTLIRIAGFARVTQPRWKRELLDEAFMRAYAATAQYRRTAMHVPANTRQFAQTQAEDTPLACIALQARATQMMATVAPARARELFEWIDLNLAPARCEEVLVPAVDEYYTTASMIARTTFRRSEGGEALRYLEYYLWRAHRPVELPPIVLAIERFRPDTAEAAHLEGFLETLMNGATSDPRSFSTANIDIVGRMADLQFADKQRNVAGWYLIEALRTYLLTQLAGPRCGDSATESMMLSTFNIALQLLHAERWVDGIDGSRIRPKQLLGSARIDFYWQTPTSRRLFGAWTQLRGPDNKLVPERIRRTDDWRDAAVCLLSDVDQWTGRDEPSDRDFFYEKGTLFANVIGLMPQSAARIRGLNLFTHFLRHEDTDRARRTLWFVFVNRLIEFWRGEGRQEVLDSMESAGDPVLSVYARLERLLPAGLRGPR